MPKSRKRSGSRRHYPLLRSKNNPQPLVEGVDGVDGCPIVIPIRVFFSHSSTFSYVRSFKKSIYTIYLTITKQHK
jgi:hypothetical protein